MHTFAKRVTTTLIPALLALNSGCIFFLGSTTGRPVDEEVFKNLAVSGLNQGQVETELGLPDRIVPLPDGTIYHYQYTKANTFLFLILGHTNREDDNVYILFDDKGILRDKKAQYLTKDLGWRLWPFGR